MILMPFRGLVSSLVLLFTSKVTHFAQNGKDCRKEVRKA